jgi:type II secretory pathway pseudopilin PulG
MKLRNILIEVGAVIIVIGLFLLFILPLFNKYRDLSTKSEIPINLKIIYESAVAYSDNASLTKNNKSLWFPSSSEVTPSIRCCNGKVSQKCIPGGSSATSYNPREWESTTWKNLKFKIEDPHLFRYQFKRVLINKNPAFEVSAFGDLDCDGKESHFYRRGELLKTRVKGSSSIIISQCDE